MKTVLWYVIKGKHRSLDVCGGSPSSRSGLSKGGALWPAGLVQVGPDLATLQHVAQQTKGKHPG